ncbi:MAG TPA: hypothetical protein VGI40_07125 [Pirellulaceae bacterium]|jgi:hypothetical protein
MPIPAFTADGFLPEGIHDCTLEELRDRFGQFQRTDRRPRLFERFEAFVREAKKTGFVVAIIVDGSFVTARDAPNDVDVIIVLTAEHDLGADLPPFAYNVVSKPQVRRLHRLDTLVARAGDQDLADHIEFFGRLKDTRDRRRGMLRIRL